MCDISIIIVSWNARKYLVECLRSLEAEGSSCSKEVIVVDNASHDGSPEAVRNDFPWVRLIESGENLGFAKGNNMGIHQSKGRYLCLANSDTLIRPGCLDNLVRYLDANTTVGIAAPRVLNPDGSIQPSCRRFPTLQAAFSRALALDTAFPSVSALAGAFMPLSLHQSRRSVDVVSGCFCAARRQALDQVGLLDEDYFMYSEDIDWCKRFHKAGWGITYLPEAEVVHFGGASSSNAPTRFSIEQQKADLLYWEKHSGKFGQACYRSILLLHQAIRLVPRALAYILWPGRRSAIRAKLKEHWACLSALL